MTTLHIDLETRSVVDLRKAGVYVYAEHESTNVWCAAYAVDDGPVELWEPADEYAPRAVVKAVVEGWNICAHNANFERTIWRHVLVPRYNWPEPGLEQWRCTMAMALAQALPGSLDNCAAALGLAHRKDPEGYSTMLRMSRPRRPRKGEDPDGVYWFDDDERRLKLYEYCRNDVEVERQIEKRLLPLRPDEQKLWWLDQKINDRGVYVDHELAQGALKVVARATGWLNDELAEITGGAASGVTNVIQIMGWLREREFPMDSLDKEHVADALIRTGLPDDVRRVLEIRQEGARGANAKIDALLAGRSKDGRAKGLLQYHQASTGRWAGRRFQPQNLPRGSGADPDEIVEWLRRGDADAMQMIFDNPLQAVSDCLRGLAVAAPGNKLMVADFSSIEARVVAWLAREQWKLDAFYDYDEGLGYDNYVMAYARAFNVLPAEVRSKERLVGKVMELALGYQGGVGAFQKMASGLGVEVSDERADELKLLWREAHPSVVQTWYDLQDKAMCAIANPGKPFYADRIGFRVVGSFMFMRLPSGRSIVYPYPCIKPKETPWGEMRDQVSYKGVDSYTRKWTDCYAHGGLLFNNAVQGCARDLEAEAMVRTEAAGYANVLNVHDEIVAEVPIDFGSVLEYEKLVTQLPTWAEGLPIAAKAWSGHRYRKD
jgi:DNA polymerase